MTEPLLGTLERVDLRSTWSSEAGDFTPWLASEENLALLGDTIGIDLELVGQEQGVGPFRADIFCRETVTDSWVLVENQLERTDHTHLGQLITYAAGLSAVTIVWVASRFTDQHRAALDWLNEVTDEGINFFGLEIQLWRIDDSLAAPKFNVIAEPNAWVKTIGQTARRSTSGYTEEQLRCIEFWKGVRDKLEEMSSPVKMPRDIKPVYNNIGLGMSGFHLCPMVYPKSARLSVEIILRSDLAKEHFAELQKHKDAIETELGEELEWLEQPDKKGSRIVLYREGAEIDDESRRDEYHEWFADMLTRFDRVFRPRIKSITHTPD